MELPLVAHTIVLDAEPIIRNNISADTLRNCSDRLVTIPHVVNEEIRDAAARQYMQRIKPFLELRVPSPKSVEVIRGFSRLTGDAQVLSRADIMLLALAYEIELELNGSDWRLRSRPGQKGLNGPPPAKLMDVERKNLRAAVEAEDPLSAVKKTDKSDASNTATTSDEYLVETLAHVHLDELAAAENANKQLRNTPTDELMSDDDGAPSEDADSEGWITPKNLKAYQAIEASSATVDTSSSKKSETQRPLQVAVLTSDFAMQNVALQMNLNLLSPSLQRIRHLKTWSGPPPHSMKSSNVLRCHACFQVVKTSPQFCPRCGKPTLTRVACSTDQNGVFKLHLKKNMQWNTRGDRYSIPKPVAGSSSGKVRRGGGGKGGWGAGLILAPDQKEYVRVMEKESKRKERNLMDEDFLPSMLSGKREGRAEKLRIGAGRNVNSRRR